MHEVPVNVVALLVATVVKFAIGGLWFSPAAFGPTWRRLAGVSDEQVKAGMVRAMIVDLIATFIMAWVLVHAIEYAGAHGPAQGLAVAFFNWLGFVATVGIATTLYENRPFRLFVLGYGYQLVGMLAMGTILASWT